LSGDPVSEVTIFNDQRRRLIASSSRTPTTRSVLRPSRMVSPGLQFGTAVLNVDGSTGGP